MGNKVKRWGGLSRGREYGGSGGGKREGEIMGAPGHLNVSSTHAIEKMADLAGPILTHLPEQYKGLKDEYRRVILLRGLGLSIAQVGQVTRYGARNIENISSKYKDAIREIALHRDLAIVTVLDQSIGMIGDIILRMLPNVNVKKATAGDVAKLAQSMESLRRAAYDIRERPHSKNVTAPDQKLKNITLEVLENAIEECDSDIKKMQDRKNKVIDDPQRPDNGQVAAGQ